MERKENQSKPDEPTEPFIIALIVRRQIEEIVEKFNRQQIIDNMNA